MKTALVTVLIALTFGTAAVMAQPFENSSVIGQVPDRVVVTVKPGVQMNVDKAVGPQVGIPGFDALAERFGVHNLELLHGDIPRRLSDKAYNDVFERIYAVDFPAEMGLQNVKAAYEALPEVEEVRLVDICKVYDAFLPDDPGLNNQQWYLRNMTLGGGDVRAVGAWNQTLGDSNVVVCVLDSGVDWHHPDLGGDHPDKVNGAIWTNWTEYYGTPGVDDDSNGKIDDIRGWDFVSVSSSNAWPGQDFSVPDNDPMDFESHGTNCAGVVAALTNNGQGIAGTAPGCKIMAVRCGWLDNTGQGVVRMDFASSGILYAIANGADIINCSWGSSSFLSLSVQSALSSGVLMITAAGNDDSSSDPSYLSTYPGVLAVAATEQSDGKSGFSNYGTWVELSAPGTAIYTTAYSAAGDEHVYASVQGTSFSSPLACGAAALLWSANPGWSYQLLSTTLRNTCDNIDDVNPAYAGLLGSGRINLLRALGDNVHQFPAEFPTMYDALNSAAAGDTIAVAGSSVVAGPLTIPDTGIKIFGGYDALFTSRDPENNRTVIQGNPSATALRFQGAVGLETEVDGFTVQGGGGQLFAGIPVFAKYAGGIMLNNQSPTLRNLEITGNFVGSSSELGGGGGIAMTGSQPVLDNVWIHGNTGVVGAGLYAFNSSPQLSGCEISDNLLVLDNGANPPRGGGIYALDSDLTLVDCDVSGHLDSEEGGGMYLAGHNDVSSLDMTGGTVAGNSAKTNGAGIYINGGSLDMLRVTLDANVRTPTATFMHGGGIFATAAAASLDSLVCTANDAHVGGALDLNNCSTADVTRSVITGNTGFFWGGALNYDANAAGSVVSNTIAANTSSSGGAGIYMTSSSPTIDNNLVAFNVGGAGFANGMALTGSSPTFSCNDVFGNANAQYSGITDPTGSNGNVSVDPLFCNQSAGNFNLTNESPCAAANSGGCGLIGALSSGCGVSPVPDEADELPTAFRVDQNFPNPFNPRTTIRFSLPSAGQTRVSIFDVAGRHVRTLVDDNLEAKVHEVKWVGDDDKGRTVAAGVYFYLVSSGENRSVGRMALVK